MTGPQHNLATEFETLKIMLKNIKTMVEKMTTQLFEKITLFELSLRRLQTKGFDGCCGLTHPSDAKGYLSFRHPEFPSHVNYSMYSNPNAPPGRSLGTVPQVNMQGMPVHPERNITRPTYLDRAAYNTQPPAIPSTSRGLGNGSQMSISKRSGFQLSNKTSKSPRRTLEAAGSECEKLLHKKKRKSKERRQEAHCSSVQRKRLKKTSKKKATSKDQQMKTIKRKMKRSCPRKEESTSEEEHD